MAYGGTLPALIAANRAWQGRRRGVEISLTIDDDEITIAEPTDAERARLLEEWITRTRAWLTRRAWSGARC